MHAASNKSTYIILGFIALSLYFVSALSPLGFQVNGDPNMPPNTNFFGGLQQPSPQAGQQMQGVGQRAGQPVPAVNYNIAPAAFPNTPTGGGGSGSGTPTTNSPHPPASSEMNPASANLPSISSPLPSVDTKTKLLSPSSSGYQGSSTAVASSQGADPLLQGGGLPSLPSIKMEIKDEPPSSVGGHPANSPHPPPSVEMSGLPSIRSLPPVDSKRDIYQSKLMTPPSSGSVSVPPSQGSDHMLQGGGVPSLPESKPVVSGNQKIVPDPSLRKGEGVYKN